MNKTAMKTSAYWQSPIFLILFFLYFFFQTPSARADKILIFAAASTAEALDKTILSFNKMDRIRIRVSYASSGILARQIENGAPANLYLSAAIEWTERLLKQRLLVNFGNNTFLSNRLVLCTPKQGTLELKIERGFALADSLRGGHLAIGDPLHVPAGKYARAALHSLGVWDKVVKRTALTTDVRNALALIEMGEVAAGIVYRSDAIASKKVRIIDTFPLTSHPPIRYTLNIVKENDTPVVREFYKFLRSQPSKTIFTGYGFEVK